MREIPLTKGYVALVDDADYDFLMQWKWNAQVTPKRTGSVKVYATRPGNKKRDGASVIWMHRLLLQMPAGMFTDHIDGDGLNNQRSNLRPCTATQNNVNRSFKSRGIGSTQYQGVFYLGEVDPRSGNVRQNPYKVTLKADGLEYCMGAYPTAEAGAYDRDRAALYYQGEFAVLNFPEKIEEYRANPWVPKPRRFNKSHNGKPTKTSARFADRPEAG